MKFEGLENRRLFSLLGIAPQLQLPTVTAQSGTLAYNATTLTFDVNSVPLLVQYGNSFSQVAPVSPSTTVTPTLTTQIHILVNNDGTLGGGAPGDDLFITGRVTFNSQTYDGVLLSGEILPGGAFGFDPTSPTFDFRMQATGGLLFDAGLFAGMDVGIALGSEAVVGFASPNPFGSSFSGRPKATIAPVPRLFEPISLSGRKFDDLQGDGLTPDDQAFAGVTIELFKDADNNGQLTAADGAAIASDVTGPGGSYSFVNLGPGTYFVREVVPVGSVQTAGLPFHTVTAVSGQSVPNLDFANFRKITITGTKVRDLTGNSFSADDTPLADVTINLFRSPNLATPIATTTTGANGSYKFENLGPGTYFVQEVLPAGYTQTGGNAGYTVVATSGTNSTGNNFANYRLAPAIDIEKYIKAAQHTGGGEGKTPGYWKQSHHFDDWTGYSPSDSYNAIFGVNDPDNPTLLQALQRGGGGYEALGRHAVAALLNAAHVNISYLYSTGQVIAMVQNAYATSAFESTKNLLAQQNELEADLSNSSPAPVSGFPAGLGDDADPPTPGPVVAPGTALMFTYVITNTGETPLVNITFVDDNATPDDESDDIDLSELTLVSNGNGDAILDIGESWTFTYVTTAKAGTHVNVATVEGTNQFDDQDKVTDSDAANYSTGTQPPPPPDQPKIDIEKYVKANVAIKYEGKTPGYWKQSQHFDDWIGYSPNDKFKDVFGVLDPSCNKNLTLLDALKRGGGGYEALGRHAVAALLNASHPNIAYLYTKAEVIAMVKQAINSKQYDATKNLFEKQNELEADLSSPVTQPTPGYGVDADTLATGLNVAAGTQLTFTLVVTNPGQTPLSNVSIVDDNGTPTNPADDRVFNKTNLISGDTDNDGELDTNETWVFSYTSTALAGKITNTAVVSATNAFNPTQIVTDSDAANYYTTTSNDKDCWDSEDKTKLVGALANLIKNLGSKC